MAGRQALPLNPPCVRDVGRRWNLKGLGSGGHRLEGDNVLERAYYVCPECVRETLFPLDRKLKLRRNAPEKRTRSR